MPITDKQKENVLDAMHEIQTESDRWNLADILKVAIPTGRAGFDQLIDAAAKEGIAAGLTALTLRFYRDTANAWPEDKRVPNVSFSAHREAERLIDKKTGSLTEAVRLLNQLAKSAGGADKVTVASVRAAVATAQGRKSTARRGGNTPPPATPQIDVLADLKDGAPKLIAAIGPATSASDLDKLQSGLSKALGHVEKRRAKVQSVKAAAKKAATTAKAAPSNGAAKKAAPAKKAARKAGDLRGL